MLVVDVDKRYKAGYCLNDHWIRGIALNDPLRLPVVVLYVYTGHGISIVSEPDSVEIT
jgi:hypothetical protein